MRLSYLYNANRHRRAAAFYSIVEQIETSRNVCIYKLFSFRLIHFQHYVNNFTRQYLDNMPSHDTCAI